MTETFRNLTEAYKIYKCYLRLNKQGLLSKKYTFDEVYTVYKNNRELIVNG